MPPHLDASDHGGPPLALATADFRTAGASVRASLVLGPDERASLHEELDRRCGVAGLAVLDTCARTEWLVETRDAEGAGREMARIMGARAGAAGLSPRVHVGARAARHALRVATGLESFVPGEREIAGQWHEALARAREDGRASRALELLGSAVGRAVRRIERTTRFRDAGQGVQRLVLRAVEGALPEGRRRVAVLGMGRIGRRIAELLAQRGFDVVPFNRTLDPRAAWRPAVSLPEHAGELDALVVATGAPVPVLRLGDLTHSSSLRLVVDVGVPPQVARTDAALTHLGLDDVLRLARGEPAARDAEQAERIVDEVVSELVAALAPRPTHSLEPSRTWPRAALPSS